MNERIQELIKLATRVVDDGPDLWSMPREVFDKEKFAKLIVRECASRVRYCIQNDLDYIAEDIEQHFGVEEQKGWVCSKCGVDRTKAPCPSGHSAAITGECPMFGVAHGVEK